MKFSIGKSPIWTASCKIPERPFIVNYILYLYVYLYSKVIIFYAYSESLWIFWDNFPDRILLLLVEETENLYPKQVQRYTEIVKISNGITFNPDCEQPGKTQIYSCIILCHSHIWNLSWKYFIHDINVYLVFNKN